MNTKEIMALSDQYVMHTYGRIGLALVQGQGAELRDAEGKTYLDFVGGLAVNSLGHCHPAVVRAIRDQAETLMHVSNLYYTEPQAKLAELLVQNSCCQRVFFCNSGAEANEAAIKLTRKYAKKFGGPEKYEIITAEKSFHGRTLAAITATGQTKYQQGFEPLPQGFKYVPFNDLAALQKAVGPHTCAVLLEPVQGEGGVIPAERDYLAGVRELCDQQGLLLIFDEVQCGLGRIGKFMAYQHYGVEPDLITLAKALAGGFPMGAMLAKQAVADVFAPGDHAATFGGNPLACAAALAAMGVMLQEAVPENCAQVGAYLKEQLLVLQQKYSFIREVRGLGLLLGMELAVEGAPYVRRCQERGLLINCAAGNVLRLLPPLIITKEEADRAVAILDAALGAE
ncbi:MAG: acetylornithine transaminase [Firmicutes bacterium]|nr:acetylornithine transaminase [Bacillota bacterium]